MIVTREQNDCHKETKCLPQGNKMLLTGEYRRERSAEGQWRGADLPGLQMMTMLMTLVLIGMMIKDCGKVQICIYIYVLYFVSSVLPKIQGVFLTGAP